MKLNLRKANAIQAAINEKIKEVSIVTNVTLNEFEDVEDQIQSVRERFFKDSAIRSNLLIILYEIRTLVSEANSNSGIDSMLAQVAYLDKQIAHANFMISRGVQTPLQVLKGLVKKNSEVKDDGYNIRTITTAIFTEQEIEDLRKDLSNFKRQKQTYQDRLLEMNIKTEIVLNDNSATFLIRNGIL